MMERTSPHNFRDMSDYNRSKTNSRNSHENLRGRKKSSSPSAVKIVKVKPFTNSQEKGRQSPVFNFNFPQYDKKRGNRKSQSPQNTSNKLNTTELCYVDLLSKVALSARSHSACLEKKKLATENSTTDLNNTQITKNASVSKPEQPMQEIPEKSPQKKNLIMNYLQNCRKAENRALKSIQTKSQTQTKSSLKPTKLQETVSTLYQKLAEDKSEKDLLNNSQITKKSASASKSNNNHAKQKSIVIDPKSSTATLNDINLMKPGQMGIDNPHSKGTPQVMRPESSQKSLKSSSNPSQPSQSPQYSSQASSRKKTDDENIELFRDHLSHSDSNKFLVQSWKKLLTVNASVKSDSILKDEIVKLMEMIREEKVSIAAEFEKLFEKINQLESERRQLQLQLSAKDKELRLLTTKTKVKGFANPKEDKTSIATTPKKPLGDNLFTLDQLTERVERATTSPSHISDNIEELLHNMRLLNNDVDSITKDTTNMNDESFAHYIDLSSLELKKTPTISFLIKDMNLNQKLFYKEPKDSLEDIGFSPSMFDVITAQKEMIEYLIKKLQGEEQQRLRTEIQSSRMISSLEKVIQQLEEKRVHTRRDLSPSSPSRSIKPTPC